MDSARYWPVLGLVGVVVAWQVQRWMEIAAALKQQIGRRTYHIHSFHFHIYQYP